MLADFIPLKKLKIKKGVIILNHTKNTTDNNASITKHT